MMKQNLTKKCHKQIIKLYIVCETNACMLKTMKLTYSIQGLPELKCEA